MEFPMKKHLAIVIATCLPALSIADEMALDLQFDEDGKATPVSTFAKDWDDSKTFFSRVKYRNLSITEQDTAQSLSRSATTLNEQFVQLSFVGYKLKTDNTYYALSGGVELIRIENSSFGFGPFGSETLVIENDVEITSTRALVSAEAGWNIGEFYIKGILDLKPAGNLSVKQDTAIEYTTSFEGGTDGSHSTDFSYGLSIDSLIPTGLGFDIGLGFEHSLLPLKYDVAQVNNTLTAFETAQIEQDETTTRYSLRFILGKETDMGRPMVGITNETLSIESGGETNDTTINYLVVGFDRRF